MTPQTKRRRATRNLDELLVRPKDSLLTAMRVIDRSRTKLAFVADHRGRIIGTLGDGDIRRAILRGARIDRAGSVGAAMHKPFKSVAPSVSRAEVLDLMRAWRIGQLPVLDTAGRMVGVHLLEELLGARERPNRAVIMAGGKGTRLRPLTENVPKPMLKVAGRPILERLVLHLVGYGIRNIFLSINYLGEMIEEHFGDGSAFGCKIRYLRETKPLGTGGALSLLPGRSDHPILVMNGDLVTQLRVDELLDFHERGSFTATMCVRPHQYEVPFGVATVEGNRLRGLREKPTEQLLANVGIYVLSRAAVSMIPKRKEYPITELFETCLEKRLAVGAYALDGDWIDVGRPDQLRNARGES
jgi:dTDP-glucose pyrophosphorylase/predicted transcriptional regulator